MISGLSTPATGYLEFIKQLMSEEHSPPECLILTHDNPDLLSRLDAAFGGNTTVLVDVPQHLWRLDEGDLLHALQWAVKRDGIKNVILVGDSSASKQRGAKPRSSSPLDPFALAQAANSSRIKSQSAFQKELKHFQDDSVIASALSDGGLSLTGLFYRAEAGVFVVYNQSTETFELLN